MEVRGVASPATVWNATVCPNIGNDRIRAELGNYMRKCQNPVIGKKDVAVSFRNGHDTWEGAGNARSPNAHTGATAWH